MSGSNDFAIAVVANVLIYNSHSFQKYQKTKFNNEVFKNAEDALVKDAFNIREATTVVSNTHKVLPERTWS